MCWKRVTLSFFPSSSAKPTRAPGTCEQAGELQRAEQEWERTQRNQSMPTLLLEAGGSVRLGDETVKVGLCSISVWKGGRESFSHWRTWLGEIVFEWRGWVARSTRDRMQWTIEIEDGVEWSKVRGEPPLRWLSED